MARNPEQKKLRQEFVDKYLNAKQQAINLVREFARESADLCSHLQPSEVRRNELMQEACEAIVAKIEKTGNLGIPPRTDKNPRGDLVAFKEMLQHVPYDDPTLKDMTDVQYDALTSESTFADELVDKVFNEDDWKRGQAGRKNPTTSGEQKLYYIQKSALNSFAAAAIQTLSVDDTSSFIRMINAYNSGVRAVNSQGQKFGLHFNIGN